MVCLGCLLGLSPSASALATLKVAWDASGDGREAGYTVHVVSAGGVEKTLDVGNTTSAAIPSLVEGSVYKIYVTAYDSTGLESDPSNELNYTVPGTTLYTLKIGAFANGSVDVSPRGRGTAGEKYPAGMVVTLNAIAAPGWAFSGWNVDGEAHPSNPLVLTMDSTKVVTPTFKPASGGSASDQIPPQTLKMELVAGKPTITVGGDFGGWVAEGSSDLVNWVVVGFGITSAKLSVDPTAPYAFYRVKSAEF